MRERLTSALGHLHDDARHTLRALRRAPGFTAAVVLTLALGLGASAAMFDVVDRATFRPSPDLRDPLAYGVVAAVLLAVAGLASAAPALRAARTDPSAALRVE